MTTAFNATRAPTTSAGLLPAGIPITAGLLFRLWLVPAIAIALRCCPDPAASISYLVVAAYALAGKRQAITALFLMFLFTMINHGLGSPISLAALLRWVVTFSAAGSVLYHGPGRRMPDGAKVLLVTTILIPLLIVVHSIVFSSVTDISILKAIAFGVALFTLMAAWSWESPAERQLTEIQLGTGLAGMALLSIPLLFMNIGYMKNTRMFMGVLAHAQSFGPTMALLAVMLLARWLTTKKMGWIAFLLIPLCGAWMYLSQARIALFAFVGGIGLAALLYPLQRMALTRSGERRVLMGRIAWIGGACLIAAVLVGPTLLEKTTEFIKKGQKSAESLTEAAMASRGFLIAKMQENIRETPLTGIGLGVPSDPEDRNRVARDPVLGLAISAPVEKGVMPIAAVEELGIPLAVVVFVWMAYLGVRAASGGFVPLAVFLAAMLTNAAEATFFSPGAMGGLVLILVTWAATSPDYAVAMAEYGHARSRKRVPLPHAAPAAA